jgi:hypothetical protein
MSKSIFQTNAIIESILQYDFREGAGMATYNQQQPMGPFRKRSHTKIVTFKKDIKIKDIMGHEYEQPICIQKINVEDHKFFDFSLSNLIKSRQLNVSLVELHCC